MMGDKRGNKGGWGCLLFCGSPVGYMFLELLHMQQNRCLCFLIQGECSWLGSWFNICFNRCCFGGCCKCNRLVDFLMVYRIGWLGRPRISGLPGVFPYPPIVTDFDPKKIGICYNGLTRKTAWLLRFRKTLAIMPR